MPLTTVADLAAEAGYQAVCMRASQAGVHSPLKTIAEAAEAIAARGLKVSMVTGDFNVAYNNDAGPDCLRRITPYLNLAKALGAPLVRVALKSEQDIRWAQTAADHAASHGLRLAHQCHTLSLFETVDGIVQTLERIDRPNFGLIYEPANLELCGQPYGAETVRRLAPWIFNVYLQNQALCPDGNMTLPTWCRGPVSFNLLPMTDSGGIRFPQVLAALRETGYSGYVTVHQAGGLGEDLKRDVQATAEYLREAGSHLDN